MYPDLDILQCMQNGTFGPRVAELRRERGLTQAELAALVGITTNSMARMERGEFKAPSVWVAAAIAKALRVRIESLLEPPRNPQRPGRGRPKAK